MNINPKVIDISHYDSVEKLNGQYPGFGKVYAAGYRGVIHKATQGAKGRDVTYLYRRKPATEAGLHWGAYHFFTADNVVDQVNNFLSYADVDEDTLMALDHETPAVSLSAARDFLEIVHDRVGRYPILYSSSSMLRTQFAGVNDPFWKNTKLWLAHYTEHPSWPTAIWDTPMLWQFTGDGNGPPPHSVPGISIEGGCDINSFIGSDDELAAEWN